MTFDHDFGYYFPLFSSLLKIEERRKGERISKNRDQKSCLSVISNTNLKHLIAFLWSMDKFYPCSLIILHHASQTKASIDPVRQEYLHMET